MGQKVRRRFRNGEVGPVNSDNLARKVPLDADLVQQLRGLNRGPHEPVFTTSTGTRLHRDNVRNRIIKPTAEEAGVPWAGWHTFRHTTARVTLGYQHRSLKVACPGVEARRQGVYIGGKMSTSSSSGGTAERVRQEYESSGETKPGFRTSEFLSSTIAAIGVLVAAAVADDFSAEEAWRLVSFLSIGYMISRGLAKLGVGRNHR